MWRLYAFGSNGSGQLGIGSTEDTSTPKLCIFPNGPELPYEPIQISAGGNHTLLHLANHSIYISGDLVDGRDLSQADEGSTITFRKAYISTLDQKDAYQCSAFWGGSVFATGNGEIFTAGHGSKGELGCEIISGSRQLQQLISFPKGKAKEMIADVACGVEHVIVVMRDGRAFGWGNGRKGQLDEPAQLVMWPRKLNNIDFPVHRAACGREFTFLINEDGRNAIIGSDKHGLKSHNIDDASDWKDVEASWGSMFVLNRSGKVESWGRNDHGQLPPLELPDIEHLSAGSEHVVALTRDGRVISWGWGEHGNCGVPTDENGDVKHTWNEIPIPQSDRPAKVVGVGAGCATSFFWTSP
ncbi:hypothetical protein MMC21_005504 [Puttea exsequens]|nr:hypothetical protein [Puttea exsequens]